MTQRAFAATACGQIHYRTEGDGPALVLLHQTPDSSRAFEAAIPGLGTERRVLAMDTPGYGDSAPPDRPYAMAGYAGAVIALLDALGIEQAAVLGNHTGASIAVEVAAAYPERVSALITVGIPFWDEAERELMRTRYMVPLEVSEDGSHLMQAWGKIAGRPGKPPAHLIQRGVVDMLKATNAIAAYAAVFDYDIAARLPLVQCPALLAAGELDILHKCSEPASKLLKDVRLHTFWGVGGYAIDLQTAEFVSTVLGFLRTVDAPRLGTPA